MNERRADEPTDAMPDADDDAQEIAVPDRPTGMEGIAPAVGPGGERVPHPPPLAPGDERLASTDPAEHAGGREPDTTGEQVDAEEVARGAALNEEPPG